MPQDLRRGLPWGFASAVWIAAFSVPWKLASQYGSAQVNTLILLATAAILSTALMAAQQRSLPRPTGFDLQVALGLAVLTLAGNLASAEAISRISPALLTVTQRAEVILVALIAWPVIGERIDGRFWIAVAIAGAGLWILYDPFSGMAVAEARGSGLGFALAATVCFASMAVLTRKVVHRIDVVAVNGLRLWMAVLLWFMANGIPAELFDIGRSQLFFAALTGFAGPFAGRLCLMQSSRYLEARTVTLATLVAPPLTLVFAYIALGDVPTADELLGGGLILVGVAVPILGWAVRRY